MEIPTTVPPATGDDTKLTVSPPLLIAFVATLVFGFGYFGLSGNILKNPAAGADAKLATTQKNTPPPPQTQSSTGEKVFLMGGVQQGGNSPFSEVWSSASPATSNWSQIGNMPLSGFVPVVYFHQKLWLLGGGIASNLFSSDVYSSSDGITWNLVTTAPWNPYVARKAVVFNDGAADAIYIFGSSAFNDIWKSQNGITWTQVTANAPWPAPEQIGMATVFRNELWISKPVGTLWPYNAGVWHSSNGSTWTQVANAPWGNPLRIDYTSLSYKNRLWVFGGAAQGTIFQGSTEVWSSVDGVNWTQVTGVAPWPWRQAHASTVFDGKMWIFGARQLNFNTDTNINDSWYSTDGLTWTPANPLNAPWAARGYHSATVTPHSFGLPDLQITSVTPDPTSFHTSFTSANFPYIIYDFVVKNNGLVPAIIPVTTKFSLYKLTGPGFIGLAGQYSPSAPVTIQPNQTYTFHAKSRGDIGLRSVTGTSTYKLVADDSNIIDESDETNNIFSPISITIIP